MKLIVVEHLETEVILGCNFCYAPVEAIRPRKRAIELANGTTVPNFKGLQKLSEDIVPILDDQKYIPVTGGPNPKLFVSKTVIL